MINPTTEPDHESLTDHARALLQETSEAVGEKVHDARDRLSAAIDSGKKTCGKISGKISDKVVEGAHAADELIHKRPYQTLALGVGLGALVGFLIGRRSSRRDS
ncbi:MAG: hypothetical protein PF961_07170 [Planctomycetota bacterium]|jgi:ElaB/YqjD/DUF883 family membrane-anchored ribosome-binding protein|nr:hypothetical protein [Planctomycetota bacterium]